MSMRAVIESIEHEMFERATREEKPKYCDDCKGYEESKDCHVCIKQEFNDRRNKIEQRQNRTEKFRHSKGRGNSGSAFKRKTYRNTPIKGWNKVFYGG